MRKPNPIHCPHCNGPANRIDEVRRHVDIYTTFEYNGETFVEVGQERDGSGDTELICNTCEKPLPPFIDKEEKQSTEEVFNKILYG